MSHPDMQIVDVPLRLDQVQALMAIIDDTVATGRGRTDFWAGTYASLMGAIPPGTPYLRPGDTHWIWSELARDTKAEWHNAVDFAEVAEALHIKTTQIMAVMNPHGDAATVLFTPHEDERIYSATLRRDADDVFVIAHPPVERVGMWDRIKAQMDQELPAIIERRIADADL